MSESEFYTVGIEFLRERKVQKYYNFAKILKVYNIIPFMLVTQSICTHDFKTAGQNFLINNYTNNNC
jgi:hypothetical protein